jgi:hypothetical protein
LNNKNIKFSISYLTNFKPSDFLVFKDFKVFKHKHKHKIISRNFFLFLILLKYINAQTKINTTLVVKPTYKKMITLLRAPYRYKLSRHQLLLSRYYIVFSFSLNFKPIFFQNKTDIIQFIFLIKNFYV